MKYHINRGAGTRGLQSDDVATRRLAQDPEVNMEVLIGGGVSLGFCRPALTPSPPSHPSLQRVPLLPLQRLFSLIRKQLSAPSGQSAVMLVFLEHSSLPDLVCFSFTSWFVQVRDAPSYRSFFAVIHSPDRCLVKVKWNLIIHDSSSS